MHDLKWVRFICALIESKAERSVSSPEWEEETKRILQNKKMKESTSYIVCWKCIVLIDGSWVKNIRQSNKDKGLCGRSLLDLSLKYEDVV